MDAESASYLGPSGDISSPSKRSRRIDIRIDPELHDFVKTFSRNRGVSITWLITTFFVRLRESNPASVSPAEACGRAAKTLSGESAQRYARAVRELAIQIVRLSGGVRGE